MLIVDLDPRVRRGLRALLETQPDIAVIGEAETATGALRLAAVLHPSVVLLDLMLPTVPEGLETLRLLAEHTRACVATSWQDGLHEVALEMGASAFVEKGCPAEGVLAAIRGVCTAPAEQESPPQLPAQVAP